MSNTKQKRDTEFIVQMAVLVVLIGLVMFGLGKSSAGSSGAIVNAQTSVSDIIPTGVPSVYGAELKISFDDVSPSDPQGADATIKVLSNIDRSETLEGEGLARYINVLYTLENGISCEFCCGARSIIFEDGKPACGCAHSYAMRGLAKYLIKYHGSEFTDEQILVEVAKWKVLFFPGIHEGKAKALEVKGIDSTNYINLASNKYRGAEKGQEASGGMVGGC